MKHVLSVFAFALLFSCSGNKEEDPLPINPNAPTGPEFGADGVSNWGNAQVFSYITYYSLIDTTSSPSQLYWPIYATVSEGDSARISWTMNEQPVTGTTQSKQWDQTLQKWVVTSSLPITSSQYRPTIPVKATVYYVKANKTVTRQTSLDFQQTKKTTDVLGVNFGMSRDQVKKAEYERLRVSDGQVEKWQEISPTLAMIGYSYNMTGTYYTFENGLLKAVSETYNNTRVFSQLRDLAKRYKIPEEIKTNSAGDLAKDYVWTNGKIKFTISLRSFESDIKVAFTYEKL